jgi:hypothetical protein
VVKFGAPESTKLGTVIPLLCRLKSKERQLSTDFDEQVERRLDGKRCPALETLKKRPPA